MRLTCSMLNREKDQKSEIASCHLYLLFLELVADLMLDLHLILCFFLGIVGFLILICCLLTAIVAFLNLRLVRETQVIQGLGLRKN